MRFLTIWCYENTIAAENSRSSPTTRCYPITGVVDPLPTTAEIYGSDDALPLNFGLKGAAAKAAAAAAFPTPLQVCLHREPPVIGGVKKLTGSLYWWVEQCVPPLHRECYSNL